MEVYGETGYVVSLNNTAMRMRNKQAKSEISRQATLEETGVYVDPFSYFAEVISGKIKLRSHDLYALDNNVTVVRILEAARNSAKSGKAVALSK
jgi:predicted dehydrogenase